MRRRAFIKAGAGTLLALPAIGQDERSRTLRIVPQANLSILDPIWTSATVTGIHGSYVFDTLYACDDKMAPRPQMAEGAETSDGGRTWRFRLREGLRFHDGEPVRSVDCVASLKRWAARDTFGRLLLAVTDTWKAVDDRTFELRLTRPFHPILGALGKPDTSFPFIMPERLASTDPDKQVTEMVGSGPYRFLASEYSDGSRVVYEKFGGYVPRDEAPIWTTGAKVAHFPRIEWTIIPDPGTAAAALMAGEVDWWERPLPDLLPMLAARGDLRVEVIDRLGRFPIMRLNCLQPPFNDLRVRQSVRLAVQQEAFMHAAVGDDASLWTLCQCEWPKRTPYHTDADAELMPGSIERGRAALAATAYAGQTAVVLNPSDLPENSALSQVTADTMRKIGMAVDLQTTDWGTLLQRRRSREPVQGGGWSVFHSTGLAIGLADPAMSYTVGGQGASGWLGWWGSAKAEELVQEWLEAPDEPTQSRVAASLGRLSLDEAGTIPLGQIFSKTAYRMRITGILPAPIPLPWGVRPV